MTIQLYIASLPARFIPIKFEEDPTTGSGSTRDQVVLNYVMGTHRQTVSLMVKLTTTKNFPRSILHMSEIGKQYDSRVKDITEICFMAAARF